MSKLDILDAFRLCRSRPSVAWFEDSVLPHSMCTKTNYSARVLGRKGTVSKGAQWAKIFQIIPNLIFIGDSSYCVADRNATDCLLDAESWNSRAA